jgi:hypothetical protein
VAHRDKFGRTTFGRKAPHQDGSGEQAPAQLPITLPLGIRPGAGSVAVEDATGRPVCNVSFEDEDSRRQQQRRFTEAEARQIALMIARLLTDVEGDRAAAPADPTIPLGDLNAENDE